jgi:hypothetical protein
MLHILPYLVMDRIANAAISRAVTMKSYRVTKPTLRSFKKVTKRLQKSEISLLWCE